MIEWAVRILTACAMVAYAYEKTGKVRGVECTASVCKLTFPKTNRWGGSDEIGVDVKSAIISEQVMREYIREVIAKESAEWYLGPTVDRDQEVVKTEEGDILQEVIGENIVRDLEEQGMDMTTQSTASKEDRYRIVLMV